MTAKQTNQKERKCKCGRTIKQNEGEPLRTDKIVEISGEKIYMYNCPDCHSTLCEKR